jgi:hypothetical protein
MITEVFLVFFIVGILIGYPIGSWLAIRWANKIARERGLPEFK